MSRPIGDASVLEGGAPLDDRRRRLAEGASALATPPDPAPGPRADRWRAASFGALLCFGLLGIVLGWVGASRTILVTEQVPYLVSGGLLGLALAIAGAVGYVGNWLAVARREAAEAEERAEQRHRELVAALDRLAGSDRSRAGGGEPHDLAARNGRQRPLRRAPRGTGR